MGGALVLFDLLCSLCSLHRAETRESWHEYVVCCLNGRNYLSPQTQSVPESLLHLSRSQIGHTANPPLHAKTGPLDVDSATSFQFRVHLVSDEIRKLEPLPLQPSMCQSQLQVPADDTQFANLDGALFFLVDSQAETPRGRNWYRRLVARHVSYNAAAIEAALAVLHRSSVRVCARLVYVCGRESRPRKRSSCLLFFCLFFA